MKHGFDKIDLEQRLEKDIKSINVAASISTR